MGRRRFGSLRRLPSGRWQARYRDGTGHLFTAPGTFPTRRDAERFLVRVESDMERGAWQDPRLGRTTFGAWTAEYLANAAHKRTTTLARDRSCCRPTFCPSSATGRWLRSPRGRCSAWPPPWPNGSPRRPSARTTGCCGRPRRRGRRRAARPVAVPGHQASGRRPASPDSLPLTRRARPSRRRAPRRVPADGLPCRCPGAALVGGGRPPGGPDRSPPPYGHGGRDAGRGRGRAVAADVKSRAGRRTLDPPSSSLRSWPSTLPAGASRRPTQTPWSLSAPVAPRCGRPTSGPGSGRPPFELPGSTVRASPFITSGTRRSGSSSTPTPRWPSCSSGWVTRRSARRSTSTATSCPPPTTPPRPTSKPYFGHGSNAETGAKSGAASGTLVARPNRDEGAG